MPRTTNALHKNSVIYKLTCNTNPTILYVGGTTSIPNRKHQLLEKSNGICTDKLGTKSIYTIIRENGGFNNFKIEVIEHYPCHNDSELFNRVLYWEERLGANKFMKSLYEIDDFCIHDKQISKCEHCVKYDNEPILCKHDRRLQFCKICKLFLLCEHNLIKKNCKKCTKNLNKCPHNILLSLCKECNKTYNLIGDFRICIHHKTKYECDICKDPSMCIHGKKANICNICNIILCTHGKKPNYCKLCPNARHVCMHNKIKYNCNECLLKYVNINDTKDRKNNKDNELIQIEKKDLYDIIEILKKYI